MGCKNSARQFDQHESAVLTGALYANKVQIKKNALVISDPALNPFIDHYLH
jgi:hypothetical protein